jgi:hypothetical protein
MGFHRETRGATQVGAFDASNDVFLGNGVAHQELG